MDEVDKIHNVYHAQAILYRIGLLETICFQSIVVNEYWTLKGDTLSVLYLNSTHTKTGLR